MEHSETAFHPIALYSETWPMDSYADHATMHGDDGAYNGNNYSYAAHDGADGDTYHVGDNAINGGCTVNNVDTNNNNDGAGVGRSFASPSVTTPWEALAVVITRNGLPQGTDIFAPAWANVAKRFEEAMEPLLRVYVGHMLASCDTAQLHADTKNPADAQYMVAQLDAFAVRSPDPHQVQNAEMLGRGVFMAAQDAATAAVVDMQQILVDQIDAVYRLREIEARVRSDLRDAEAWMRQTLGDVQQAASMPRGGVTVTVVMQAMRDVLEQHGLETGSGLHRHFYSAVVSRASTFGASQPLKLADASRVGLAALERLEVGARRVNALAALGRHDFGQPLAVTAPAPTAYTPDVLPLSRLLTNGTK